MENFFQIVPENRLDILLQEQDDIKMRRRELRKKIDNLQFVLNLLDKLNAQSPTKPANFIDLA